MKRKNLLFLFCILTSGMSSCEKEPSPKPLGITELSQKMSMDDDLNEFLKNMESIYLKLSSTTIIQNEEEMIVLYQSLGNKRYEEAKRILTEGGLANPDSFIDLYQTRLLIRARLKEKFGKNLIEFSQVERTEIFSKAIQGKKVSFEQGIRGKVMEKAGPTVPLPGGGRTCGEKYTDDLDDCAALAWVETAACAMFIETGPGALVCEAAVLFHLHQCNGEAMEDYNDCLDELE